MIAALTFFSCITSGNNMISEIVLSDKHLIGLTFFFEDCLVFK